MNTLNLIKLKIKVKHLATEPAIIRHEERKLRGFDKKVLQDHRKTVVRNEARATQLAILFLKGKAYKTAEPVCKDFGKFEYYIVPRIVTMVNKYKSYSDPKVSKNDIVDWAKE